MTTTDSGLLGVFAFTSDCLRSGDDGGGSCDACGDGGNGVGHGDGGGDSGGWLAVAERLVSSSCPLQRQHASISGLDWEGFVTTQPPCRSPS